MDTQLQKLRMCMLEESIQGIQQQMDAQLENQQSATSSQIADLFARMADVEKNLSLINLQLKNLKISLKI